MASPRRQRRRRPAASRRPARPTLPPDASLAWTADIEWRRAPDGSRFYLVARAEGSSERTTLSTSRPLEWPPTSPDTVKALNRAVEELEAAALAGGWKPAGAGRAWYSRRFTWEPPEPAREPEPEPPEEPELEPSAPEPLAPVAPAPEAMRRRPPARAAWPADAADLHRAEISWRGGFMHAGFRVRLYRPDGRRGAVLASSKTFKWLLADDPDPKSRDVRDEVERLSRALRATGWEPAGRGSRWFARRFVWRHERPPPERLPGTAPEEP